MSKKPAQPQDKYVLRLPDGMREQIKRSAEESGRSMNAEILAVLREQFPERPSMEELLEEMEFSISVLRELSEKHEVDKFANDSRIDSIIYSISGISDQILERISDGNSPLVFRINSQTKKLLEKFGSDSQLEPALGDNGLINGLITMGLNRVYSGEENLKVYVGYGDDERLVEIDLKDELSKL